MIYLLRIFFWRRSALAAVVFFSLAFLVLEVFNVLEANLHGIFWQKLKRVYPESYLVPSQGTASLAAWSGISGTFPETNEIGLRMHPLCQVPAVIEYDDQTLGVMLNAYLDFSKKAGEYPDVFRGNPEEFGIWIGKNIACSMGVKPGAAVRLFLLDRNAVFQVAGTVETGFYDYDSYYVFGSFDLLETLGERPFISEVELHGNTHFKGDLAGNFPGFRLESFWERNPELAKAFRTEKLFFLMIRTVFLVTIFLVLLVIYQWRLDRIRRDMLVARVMGIGGVRIFLVLFFDLVINFHAGLAACFIMISPLFFFVREIRLPEGMYGIENLEFRQGMAMNAQGYVWLLLCVALVSLLIFTKTVHDDIIGEIRR
ncbi:MAG: hypothetical protein PHQ23_08640 [Candidatus Wallbacteria bacterium]|nr:hypothetical protein [Candidatus Wallbacteria bacterium]